MDNVFELAKRPDEKLFFFRNDPDDSRLGEVVGRSEDELETADIVIVGCPQDEGVIRSHGRPGTAIAPSAIREQFYQLSTFNVRVRIFDLGDIGPAATLEETHDRLFEALREILSAGKRVILVGGGNDISYPAGKAMAEVFGDRNWIAINVDAHLDVAVSNERHSGTPFRQLLDEELLRPSYFYEVGYQSHFCSPTHFDHLRSLGVNRISLELLRSRAEADIELRESIRQKFIGHSSSLNTFFAFDMHAVRSSDAPGTSDPSPLGLRAGEFIQLVKYAASLANTRMVLFSEANPNFDVDGRTSRLIAIAMHRFCSGQTK